MDGPHLRDGDGRLACSLPPRDRCAHHPAAPVNPPASTRPPPLSREAQPGVAQSLRHAGMGRAPLVVWSWPLGQVAGPVPVGPSTIRMDGGSRTPSRRFWRPVLFQLSYVHLLLLLLSCALPAALSRRGILGRKYKRAAPRGCGSWVLVTRGLPPQLERPGVYRCLTAPTRATPDGSAATDPWSRSRAHSLRSSTATGQHPAHGSHCDS